MDVEDVFGSVSGAHFGSLMRDYGAPVLCVNLVKLSAATRTNEQLLHQRFYDALSYLNQFVDDEHALLYCHFDVARCHKQVITMRLCVFIHKHFYRALPHCTNWNRLHVPLCNDRRSSRHLRL